MSNTYAGSTLAIVNAEPATLDQAGYEALAWVTGDCALKGVPEIAREWVKVTDELVCSETNTDKKGSSKWKPVTFQLNRLPADAAQAIYETLEADRTGVGSFRLVLPGTQGTVYFTAQVSMYSIVKGGGQDEIVGVDVELLIQTTPVLV